MSVRHRYRTYSVVMLILAMLCATTQSFATEPSSLDANQLLLNDALQLARTGQFVLARDLVKAISESGAVGESATNTTLQQINDLQFGAVRPKPKSTRYPASKSTAQAPRQASTQNSLRSPSNASTATNSSGAAEIATPINRPIQALARRSDAGIQQASFTSQPHSDLPATRHARTPRSVIVEPTHVRKTTSMARLPARPPLANDLAHQKPSASIENHVTFEADSDSLVKANPVLTDSLAPREIPTGKNRQNAISSDSSQNRQAHVVTQPPATIVFSPARETTPQPRGSQAVPWNGITCFVVGLLLCPATLLISVAYSRWLSGSSGPLFQVNVVRENHPASPWPTSKNANDDSVEPQDDSRSHEPKAMVRYKPADRRGGPSLKVPSPESLVQSTDTDDDTENVAPIESTEDVQMTDVSIYKQIVDSNLAAHQRALPSGG